VAYKKATKSQISSHKDNYLEQLPLLIVSDKNTQKIGTSEYDKAIEKAQKAYADAINDAKVKVEEGIMTEDDQDKAILSAKEQLSNAYLKAYNATGDSKYLEAQKEVAESMVFMKGVIEQSAQEQKQLEQQTRELNEQEKKISDATEELYQAMKDGDLKGFYAASKKLKSAGGEDVSYKGTVKATQENMSALTAHLREGLGKAEVGSADFSKLSANRTFILKEKETLTVTGGRLPLGILESVEPAEASVEVYPGDVVIMTSDGIADELKDGQMDELQTLITPLRALAPDEIAARILSWAQARDGEKDDMTVIVFRILQRC
jgi:serine/threonine protein phosphatase PrpC